MINIYCDRCGKDITNYGITDEKPCALIEANINHIRYNLCGECKIRAIKKPDNAEQVEYLLKDIKQNGNN
jgi:hypothetical protein